MLSLSVLVWLTLIAALAAFWWHSDLVKNEALKLANSHCRKLGLQLLDHSMVIKSIVPARDAKGSACFRRRYRFEFTSTGEERYQGEVMMLGRKAEKMYLEPHILPPERQPDSHQQSAD
ncbi:MAG: DUF3301 domain-containing protein [Gammaproteobacteria bacterium]|jgi:hypothetical protein